MVEKINIYVGFDQVESVAYHVFCQSIIEKASSPVQFCPLVRNSLKIDQRKHDDGSNQFTYSRFLIPYLNNFSGWAIFADGDMVCNADIVELFNLRDETKAVQVVKHDYKTKKNIKYLGYKNEDYPRKNWSSLVLWNCSHIKNLLLTPDFIENKSGSFLHRFSWLEDNLIGELPLVWNWLAIEYPEKTNAKIVHYTLGTPCFKEYSETSMAEIWHQAHKKASEGLE